MSDYGGQPLRYRQTGPSHAAMWPGAPRPDRLRRPGAAGVLRQVAYPVRDRNYRPAVK